MRFRWLTLLLSAAAAALAAESTKNEKAKPAPRAKSTAEALFRARCSVCHDPGRVFHRSGSRGEWREIVYRMQRMPQSGISPREAETILDYLAGRGTGRRAATPQERLGGRDAFGGEWLSILEVATVKNGRVRLGRAVYTVERDGTTVFLKRGKRTRTVSLSPKGRPETTSRSDHWRVGTVTYELHVVLYELRGETVRVARALKRVGE